ncbi:response regulator transcription factor [Enemella evansiae]|uniref:DNA-binding response regulator n=1 Tax=Enemella evansiae TaxID=2016499 RepID=A0A255GMT1_9ACTN|nr:sigma-70 family RNA polymerase sigma factor [Enemella evansiae]OYO01353.1 DNA-binding response regulator [Enemella evansiae]OYO07398.1 DNA-binding response regulator [Enemella evansiae]OYO14304.1 DNA-binding response regulator [Enemella evansiae]
MTTSPEPDTVEPGTPEPVVYVVDDDPELLESVSWLLESIGIDAVSIDSADAFLSRYSGDHPALVVLDVRMPRISGTRLQEILNEQLPHVAIIFVSAHGDIKMSVRTMQRGAIDFLEKPYEPQQMLEVVQAGIGTARERFLDHAQRRDVQQKVDSLTPREREILCLVVEGLPSQNIARRLGMSVKTVDVHRARIKQKTDADSINTLVRDILRYGAIIEGP